MSVGFLRAYLGLLSFIPSAGIRWAIGPSQVSHSYDPYEHSIFGGERFFPSFISVYCTTIPYHATPFYIALEPLRPVRASLLRKSRLFSCCNTSWCSGVYGRKKEDDVTNGHDVWLWAHESVCGYPGTLDEDL